MTQLEKALNNETTKEMKYVAKQENIDVNTLKENITKGLVVIPSFEKRTNK